MNKIGLNLYSLRTMISSEKDFIETAIKLKDMGYSYLQFSGAPFDIDIIKKVTKILGLDFVLTHMPFDRIVNDTEKLIAEHREINCNNIGLGAMPSSVLIDEVERRATIFKLDTAAKKIAKAGLKFFYHHHHYEFFKFKSGQTIFDYMIENAPHINFTLDTYWLQYAGVNILEYIEKLHGRIDCVHLKDYKIVQKKDKQTEFEPRYAAIGDGTLNFSEIVNKMKGSVKYYLVEQDDAVSYDNPLNEVEKSIKYLKGNIFKS